MTGTTTWWTLFNEGQAAVKRTHLQNPTAGNSRPHTVTVTAPEGAKTVSVRQYGPLLSVPRKDSGNPDATLAQTTYGYDAHGRQNTMADLRNGTTKYAFIRTNKVQSMTTPAPWHRRAAANHHPLRWLPARLARGPPRGCQRQ